MINGIAAIEFNSWGKFSEFITGEFVDFTSYVFRGHSDSAWLLEPSLDRLLKRAGEGVDHERVIFSHLSVFMKAVRGRRGPHPPKLETEDEWWALGQHHGLATPLLDWTKSPYVAAFFAYAVQSTSDRACIFGLHTPSVRHKSEELRSMYKPSTGSRPPGIFFISPFSDENARLISQNALFTRAPTLTDIESWIAEHFSGDSAQARLIKMLLPNSERELALKSLNRMNINPLSLFPDLIGASQFSNLVLEVDRYDFI